MIQNYNFIYLQMHVTTRNVPFFILIPNPKFGIARGMTEDFAGMDQAAVIGMYGVSCAWIIYRGIAHQEQIAQMDTLDLKYQ